MDKSHKPTSTNLPLIIISHNYLDNSRVLVYPATVTVLQSTTVKLWNLSDSLMNILATKMHNVSNVTGWLVTDVLMYAVLLANVL